MTDESVELPLNIPIVGKTPLFLGFRTMTKKQACTINALRTESPWSIAERLGIDYSGDMSPIPHGGYFYCADRWLSEGVAETVEFDEYENRVQVTLGTINRGDIDDMKKALRCCGWRYACPTLDDCAVGIVNEHDGSIVADDDATITRVEIEASKAYYGSGGGYDSETFHYIEDYSEVEFEAFKFAVRHIRALKRS